MKTLKDFYEEKKKKAIPALMVNTFSKPKFRQPLDAKEQAILNKYIHQIYNPRIKKLKEPEQFREEWLEPEIV